HRCLEFRRVLFRSRGHLSQAPARPNCNGAHTSACGRDEAFRVVRLSSWHYGRSASEFLSQKPYNAIRAAKQESGIPKASTSATASWRSSAQSAVTNRLIALALKPDITLFSRYQPLWSSRWWSAKR